MRDELKFAAYLNMNYDPASEVFELKGIKHLQPNAVANELTGKDDNYFILPLVFAIRQLALNTVLVNTNSDGFVSVCTDNTDKKSVFLSSSIYAKDNAIFASCTRSDSTYDFRCVELCCVAASYAIINDRKCAEAFALLLKNINYSKALAYLHMVVLDYLIINDCKVIEEDLTSNGKPGEYLAPRTLSSIIGKISCSKLEKKLFVNKQPNVFPVTEHFEEGSFPDEPHFIVNSDYRLDSTYNSVCNSIVRNAKSVLLYGPAGTGKSVTAKLICKEVGLPVMAVVNCTANTDEFLLGKYVMVGDTPRFVESSVTKAIRNGGAVVFEEINFAKPQHLAFLNSLLDDNGFVILDNQEYVKRHPNFRFFATMNDGYAGTKQMNEALLNRIDISIEVAEMPLSKIKSILLETSPSCEKYVDNILEVYKRIRSLMLSGETDCVISVRNLISWVKLAQFEDYRTAAEHTIVGSAVNDTETREAYKEILDTFLW